MTRILSLSVLISILLLTYAPPTTVTATVSTAQRAALVGIYQATGGASWTISTNWPTGDPCDNSWFGITCDVSNTNVTAIALSNNNLVGTLPSSTTLWSALSSVTTISLSYNSLTGEFVSLLSIGASLTAIDLASNELTGNIGGAEWLLAPNLQSIYVVNNRLTGTIPTQWNSLSKVNLLGFSFNQLTGTIPPMGGMTSLIQLFGGGNQLTGPLPASLGDTGVVAVGFENNQLSGSIPDNWQKLGLVALVVYGNKLSGNLPTWLPVKWPYIYYLWINDNQFTGEPFPLLCPCTGLGLLSLANNQFSGPLSSCIGGMTGVGTLNLNNNNFTGPIPDTIGLLTHLKTLDLSNNGLTAVNGLPRSMKNLTALQVFNAGSNPLGFSIDGSESVPESGGVEPLSMLPFLNSLDLSNAGLTGNMASLSLHAPGHIFSNLWVSLVELNMNRNKLTGKPSGNIISAMPIVHKVDLSNNPLLTGDVNDLSGLTTLLLTGCPLLRWSSVTKALPSSIRVASELGGITLNGVSCPQFTGVSGPKVFQIDPSYYDYELCQCQPGYFGTAPTCVTIPDTVSQSSFGTIVAPTFDSVSGVSSSITGFADSYFGTTRKLDGMDLSWTIDSAAITGVTAANVKAIFITFALNRTCFHGFANVLSVYAGDASLQGERYAVMRGSDSIMQNLIQVPTGTPYANTANSDTMVAIVFGPKATVNFNSRDTSGLHFTVSYQLSTVCPDGYRTSLDASLFCERIPPIYSPNSVLTVTVFAVNGFVLAVQAGLTVISLIRRNSAVIRSSSLLFNLVVMLGLALLSIGGMMWAITPDMQSICHARGWLVAVPLTLALGALLVKTNRIRRIFTAKQFQKQVLPNRVLLQQLAVIMAGQLAFSIAYSAGEIATAGLAEGSGPTSGYRVWSCNTSTGFTPWFALQIVFIGILLLATLMNAIATRSVPTLFNESVWLGGCTYVFLFFGIIFLPLQTLISSSPDGLAIVNGLGVGIASLTLTGLLFGSKMYYLYLSGQHVSGVIGTVDGSSYLQDTKGKSPTANVTVNDGEVGHGRPGVNQSVPTTGTALKSHVVRIEGGQPNVIHECELPGQLVSSDVGTSNAN